MLNNFELEQISENYGMKLNPVVMKDEMQSLPAKNGNYIINLQSSTAGMGTHWCALCIEDKDIFYFDSFGIICPIEVTTFCKRISKSSLAYNDLQIQHVETQTCGWYCINFLLHLKNRNKNKDIYKSANEFISNFSHLPNKNNAKLKQYFRGLPNSKSLTVLSKLYNAK
jgi:hypothetical protein